MWESTEPEFPQYLDINRLSPHVENKHTLDQ